MEENKQSSEAPKEEAQNSKLNGEADEKEEICKGDLDAAIQASEQSTSRSCTVETTISTPGEELGASEAGKAVAPVQLSERDFNASSHLLSEVPVEYSLQPLDSAEGFKGQHEGLPHDCPSKSEQSPTSVTQSISSISSPSLPKSKSSPLENGNSFCVKELDKQNALDPKPLSALPAPKTSDGYNWRKYGQKQVKSPEGSRSYYRCTYSDCYAKKIECSDRSNRVIEVVYRSNHNHDPPQKVNCARESKLALPSPPANGSNDIASPVKIQTDSTPASSLKKEPIKETALSPVTKQDSSGSEDTIEADVKEEHVDESEQRKRQKTTMAGDAGSASKPERKPKYVVHAAGDVGISGDGYRWRKYGQKMVKGNPHPRNYYRCTSAGCPVRKHIERAVDNTSAVVITYKGVHDHDMPVPKKRHGPPNTPLVTAASPASLNNSPVTKSGSYENQESATQSSVGKKGELPGETLATPDGEKTAESARTLLSIGFEIKPC